MAAVADLAVPFSAKRLVLRGRRRVQQWPRRIATQVDLHPCAFAAAHGGEEGAADGSARADFRVEANGPAAAGGAEEAPGVEVCSDAQHGVRGDPVGGYIVAQPRAAARAWAGRSGAPRMSELNV